MPPKGQNSDITFCQGIYKHFLLDQLCLLHLLLLQCALWKSVFPCLLPTMCLLGAYQVVPQLKNQLDCVRWKTCHLQWKIWPAFISSLFIEAHFHILWLYSICGNNPVIIVAINLVIVYENNKDEQHYMCGPYVHSLGPWPQGWCGAGLQSPPSHWAASASAGRCPETPGDT